MMSTRGQDGEAAHRPVEVASADLVRIHEPVVYQPLDDIANHLGMHACKNFSLIRAREESARERASEREGERTLARVKERERGDWAAFPFQMQSLLQVNLASSPIFRAPSCCRPQHF